MTVIAPPFDRAVEIVLEHEGVLSDDKRDPGGLTKYGISRKAYPRLDIANLTREQAIDIYRADYWLKAGCDKREWPMALAVFDCAVNQGVGAALGMVGKSGGELGNFMAERAVRYARNPNFALYGRGWMRRLFNVHKEALR